MAVWGGVVMIGAVFTLARFSEAFLVLRAQQVGISIAMIPLVMVMMNLFYALSAYPAGALSDSINRNHVLSIGLLFLIAADLLPAGAATPSAVQVGTGLWGLHMGFTEGILATLVASVIAGWLWDFRGGSATFYAGAGFSSLVVILTAFGRK